MASPYPHPFKPSALSLALLLTGCQLPLLNPPQPPAAPEGPCLTACRSSDEQCRERQRAREQLCQEQRARLDDPKRTCDPRSDPLCPRPIDCLGEDLTPCRVQYDECVRRCASTLGEQTQPKG